MNETLAIGDPDGARPWEPVAVDPYKPLSYKLACLCMIAMFAGNAQANFIHTLSGDPADTLNQFGVLNGEIFDFTLHTDNPLKPNVVIPDAEALAGFQADLKIGPTVTETNTDGSDFLLILGTGNSKVLEHFLVWFASGNLYVSVNVGTLIESAVASALTTLPTISILPAAPAGTTRDFVLIDFDPGTGSFNSSLTALNGGSPGTWNAQVPEPTSLLLLLTGMVGLTAAKRRNKGMLATGA